MKAPRSEAKAIVSESNAERLGSHIDGADGSCELSMEKTWNLIGFTRSPGICPRILRNLLGFHGI